MGSVPVKGTRKIRAYPKDPELLHELVRQQRRADNLAIACSIEVDRGLVDPNGPDLKQTVLRSTIRAFVRSEVQERGGTFRSTDCDEAVNAAFRTRDAVIRRRAKGERCGFSFRSIRDIRQRIAVQKLSGAFVARNFGLAEAMPDEAWGKLTTIVPERGQWFICAQKHITTVGQDEIQVRSIVALDPGVRTFVTAYAVNHAASYGDGFYADKVFPLLLKLDRLVGQRAKARHGDWKRHYQKRIDRLAIRVRNLVDDLHRSGFLRSRSGLRCDPAAVLRDEGHEREVRAQDQDEDRALDAGSGPLPVQADVGVDVPEIRQEAHHRQRGLYQQDPFIGRHCEQHRGGSKTAPDGTIIVDRDMNGARGIMLRALYGNLGRFQAAGADVALVAE